MCNLKIFLKVFFINDLLKNVKIARFRVAVWSDPGMNCMWKRLPAEQLCAENEIVWAFRHHDQLGRPMVLFPSLSDSVINYYLAPVTSGTDLKGILAVTNGHHLLGWDVIICSSHLAHYRWDKPLPTTPRRECFTDAGSDHDTWQIYACQIFIEFCNTTSWMYGRYIFI